MNRLPAEISVYISKLTSEINEIKSIWLIGSRANDSYRVDSDWDFLIFGENLLLCKFAKMGTTTATPVDILVVNDYPLFSSCDGKKTGSLADWEWRVSGGVATYKGTKFVPAEGDDLSQLIDISGSELGHEVIETKKGELVWER